MLSMDPGVRRGDGFWADWLIQQAGHAQQSAGVTVFGLTG
jgi:hypothetical protein